MKQLNYFKLKLVCTFLLSVSYFSYSQTFTLPELLTLTDMNGKDLKTYLNKKGFSFLGKYGTQYTFFTFDKDRLNKYNELSFDQNFLNRYRYFNYKTHDFNEVDQIINQMINIGFSYKNSEFDKDMDLDITRYTLNRSEFVIFRSKSSYTIQYTFRK
jgi:hypothetical protein